MLRNYQISSTVAALVSEVNAKRKGTIQDMVDAFEANGSHRLIEDGKEGDYVTEVSFSPIHGGIYGGTREAPRYVVIRAKNYKAEREPFGAIEIERAREIYSALVKIGMKPC